MLDFGVIKSREKKTTVEKYDFPVLVVNPRTDIIGGVQKFELNKAAVDLFEFSKDAENFIGLAFDANKKLVLVNLGENQAKIMAKVNKDFSFNSRKIYDIICKHFEIFPSGTHEFRLDITKDEDSGLMFGNMVIIGTPPEERISIVPTYEDEVKEDMYYADAQVLNEDFYNNN